jgi:hypothetical protein
MYVLRVTLPDHPGTFYVATSTARVKLTANKSEAHQYASMARAKTKAAKVGGVSPMRGSTIEVVTL